MMEILSSTTGPAVVNLVALGSENEDEAVWSNAVTDTLKNSCVVGVFKFPVQNSPVLFRDCLTKSTESINTLLIL